VTFLINNPAVMTLNGFQQEEGGGGPATCVVRRRGAVRQATRSACIQDSSNLGIVATVVDRGRVRRLRQRGGISAHIWHNFRLDPSLGEVSISFSDVK
jgi:hypothetical protein